MDVDTIFRIVYLVLRLHLDKEDRRVLEGFSISRRSEDLRSFSLFRGIILRRLCSIYRIGGVGGRESGDARLQLVLLRIFFFFFISISLCLVHFLYNVLCTGMRSFIWRLFSLVE